MLCRFAQPSSSGVFCSFMTVRRGISRSLEICSKKTRYLKKDGKKGRGGEKVPANFAKCLQEWPKMLQHEIDAENAKIKDLLAASSKDWTELESRGLALGNLKFAADFVDPVEGRLVAFANSAIKTRQSGSNRGFRVGTPVVLCKAENLQKVAECVYLKSNRKEITLKLRTNRNVNFGSDDSYVIMPSTEVGAIQSLQDILAQKHLGDSPGIHLVKYAFNDAVMPSIHNDRIPSAISEELNECQKRAVAAALNNKRPFVCIQGPPGTGKTRVIAEIIRFLSERRQKVLVCAPSHVAVENAMNKSLSVMRAAGVVWGDSNAEDEEDAVGSKRLEEAILEHPLYLELCDLNEQFTASDNSTEKEKLHVKFRKLKRLILLDCYKRRRVIFCTLGSSVVQRLNQVQWKPDVVIIDEAAQCIEPLAWAAILKAKRCILVGDHAQLPAVIKSDAARKAKLGVSLMERLCSEYKSSNISHLLSTQYRMNEKIMLWSSDHLYESRLIAGEDVAKIRLSDISLIREDRPFDSSLLMFDTAALKDRFVEQQHRLSIRNCGEAVFVSEYARFLVGNGVASSSIGIITPYFAQVQMIREFVDSSVTVNTVDAFQGQEKEVIIFSMVRNNPEKIIGFLSEVRRMNVAVTRARRQFCLVGNSSMMRKNRDLRILLRYIKEHGYVTSPDKLHFLQETEELQPKVSQRII